MNKLIVIFLLFTFASCHKNSETKPVLEEESLVNFDHFNHLYKEIDFNGKRVGIVHIYSQYPDYDYAIEPSEGFTCVDDVSRAMVLMSNHLKTHADDEGALSKLELMTEFILQMQHTNGYFNNFIWNDLSINTTYQTSVAELNWWSFRALWGLESAYPLLTANEALAGRIALAVDQLMTNIKNEIPYNTRTTELIETIEVPTWLPQKYASDQAALLILGLLKHYERTDDASIIPMIDAMAEGIILMQKGGEDSYPYGAFLSWGNLWHAWGNGQAYALLKAGQKLENQLYIDSALKEIDHFYPYLLLNGFAEAFWINATGSDSYIETDRHQYPQIAYGLRPMVWAASEAYQYSKNEKYRTLTENLTAWLSGENDAQKNIYTPSTGICFDGIVSASEINKNSGAESTIESLLILTGI